MATDPKDDTPKGSASSAYQRMRPDRDPYLVRARRCAKLTIPALYREEGDLGAADEEVPWNTVGAYVTSQLGAKVVKALWPVGSPPMRLNPDRKAVYDLTQMEDKTKAAALKQQIDTGLSKVEGEFVQAVEEDGDRSRLVVAALKMIVGGNHGFQFYDDGTIRGLPLERWAVTRDPSGNLLEFAIEDPLAYATLPQDIRAMCETAGYIQSSDKGKTTINVYTHGVLADGKWRVYQEVFGQPVPDGEATYESDFLPYLFCPWTLLDGEHYGRSYVELYEGDLTTIEGNTQTITEGSSALAVFLRFVHPAGLTNKKAVATARNGDVLTGRAEDVTVMDNRVGTGNFQSAQWVTEQAMTRIQRAFLITERRGGERVTATEIAADAKELEEGLGGVYSQQVVTWQAPFIRLKLNFLQKAKRVTPLPKGMVRVTIVAGMAALGRNAELAALDDWLGGAERLFGPEQVSAALGPNAIRTYLKRRASALNVPTDGLIPTDEEAAELDQQNTMKAMMNRLGPEAIKQFGSNLTANDVANTHSDATLGAATIKAEATPAAQPTQGA